MTRVLAPWLQSQLKSLLQQRGHAWLLAGPSGLGQFELAAALAKAWLCENATPQGACSVCGSCHAVDVHTHADLAVLMPELLSLELGWPLDEKTQDDLDSKKRKPSKEIKVDAAREVVSFTHFTRSRGTTKVVLVSTTLMRRNRVQFILIAQNQGRMINIASRRGRITGAR